MAQAEREGLLGLSISGTMTTRADRATRQVITLYGRVLDLLVAVDICQMGLLPQVKVSMWMLRATALSVSPMRCAEGNNSQFFRLAEPEDMDRIWLNISGNDLFNQTLVVFKDDATELRDVMYDAHKVRGNANIALGAMQANEPYAIAVYPTITQPRIVPLQTFVAQSGTYTFEADSIDGFEDIAIYLEDLQTGHMYLLSQGTTVTVQMTAQDEFNRFQLWMSPELVTGIDEEEEGVSRIISTVNGMQVQMGIDISTAGEFKLYNAMGQVVMVQPLSVSNGRSGMVDVSALPIGVYHAEFRSAEGTITAKTIK
jgi:hypothetical protein